MANLDWKNLPFSYIKTNYNIRCHYRNGKWGEVEVSSDESVNLHIAATCAHYGQAVFEGTKAFKGQDGKIRLFRWKQNAQRLNRSAKGLLMPELPQEIFAQAIKKAVLLNKEFVPPYESGASLYIRPFMIGTGAQIGVSPATEYLFLILVTPVGPYFKAGFKPVDFVIYREYDRAAPLGTGNIKVAGNYAASLAAGQRAKAEGYSAVIYLDAKEKKYIDECGPANFFAIKNNTYITPQSQSILPSITNESLKILATDFGMDVQVRPVSVDELGSFDEAGACGTAAVISPIRRIFDNDLKKEYIYCHNDKPGPVSEQLYRRLLAIQYGDHEDKFDWVDILGD